MGNDTQNRITYFTDRILETTSLPERFTFPFYYEPHPLTQIAASELQEYLESESDMEHNFGLIENQEGIVIGKMFGVLVVRDANGKIGYLSAFSGKLAGTNQHPRFVPPVFDMLLENSFFLKEETILNSINSAIETIHADPLYQRFTTELEQFTKQSQEEIAAFKKQLRANKETRKKSREAQKNNLTESEYTIFEADLIKQSLRDKWELQVLTNKWKERLDETRLQLAQFEDQVEALKKERKEKSAALQQQLFEQYSFLNKDGITRSLQSIFSETVFGKPPAAAGECATPKLLQYAFANGYEPLAMAEFWWGASPKSEIRKHRQFYPACTGKCQPILKHMLEGIPMDPNPLLENHGENTTLKIIYEDDSLIVVDKPAELLSVPGIQIQDSVYTRLKTTWGTIEPLIIHRLDMATSGLLVVAKTKEAHKHIQRQFLKRTVIKRYTALLSGLVKEDEGEIRLPLRGDLDNRPRQLVCDTHGKKAVTLWKVVARQSATTRIHFWPLTGRTHQLRMHAAHEHGLNAPIVGDDLYGTSADRLHLHAAYLEFVHPKTRETLRFEVKESF
ncbi:RNA pseudouridine synthase [Flavobacterium supellecticarium]|uniref:RNA pseudouridine synthase n=1 Tax=Flavobacterium supellecticarium TaxID=2565924 RepID=A0A4S4A4T9_9FLAO|nr:RluA family pseudouridine synthase [Flavobacterium supellecticarium]THF53323.1 RNA pseudouridine synthase [Flavobacterium supellecticarium]